MTDNPWIHEAENKAHMESDVRAITYALLAIAWELREARRERTQKICGSAGPESVSHVRCELPAGHDGPHENSSEGNYRAWRQ